MALHYTALGESGSRVVFLHGLFGQGRNWTAIAKQLASSHRVLLLDLPHHGRSPWPERFDYLQVADLVMETVAELAPGEPVNLVGHSLGGKVAMVAALRHRELVERLVVADISPVDYGAHREFVGYIAAMCGMDLSQIGQRADADQALQDAVRSPVVRSFLLQNLRRDPAAPSGWSWQANLEVLGRDLDVISTWPRADLAGLAPYPGPVLWLAGGKSDYVRPEFEPEMDRYFPRNRKVVIKNAGHWLHSEQPEVFVAVLTRFLAN